MKHSTISLALLCLLATPITALAGVSKEEAAQLGSSLTPLGGERAGNKDGTIPEWTGGFTTVPAGYKSGAKNADPFAGDKVLFSITAKNAAQYADKLSDGQLAMLKKYPDTYRIDVYPTRRTAVAAQWIYDRTKLNAVSGKIVEGPNNPYPADVYGGVPFPIPKSGLEVIWNHLMHPQADAFKQRFSNWLTTAEGSRVLTAESINENQNAYYFKGVNPGDWNGTYRQIAQYQVAPAMRAGEGIVGFIQADDTKSGTWVYLTGQRRVRKLPVASGDTPAASTSGVMNYDDLSVFFTHPGNYDWKLVGKKEMFIPYNNNRFYQPARDQDVMSERHLHPDHVRWELHRVWVVDTVLKAGKRNTARRGRYYIDEDSWIAVLGDRWDGHDQLWKSMWQLPSVYPEYPIVDSNVFGFYDLISGAWFANGLMNGPDSINLERVPRRPDAFYTPDALVSRQLR
jgi:Protein of unknown function (DUF1329)